MTLDEQCNQVLGGSSVKFARGLGVTYVRDWSPSTNADDSRDLEDEIERRGLIAPYMQALIKVILADRAVNVFSSWYLVRATPEQRTRAFLEVVKR